MWDLIVSVPDNCLSFYFLYFFFIARKSLRSKASAILFLTYRHSVLSVTQQFISVSQKKKYCRVFAIVMISHHSRED